VQTPKGDEALTIAAYRQSPILNAKNVNGAAS
jgi:hypothetical protein